jgi:hypothetical protein
LISRAPFFLLLSFVLLFRGGYQFSFGANIANNFSNVVLKYDVGEVCLLKAEQKFYLGSKTLPSMKKSSSLMPILNQGRTKVLLWHLWLIFFFRSIFHQPNDRTAAFGCFMSNSTRINSRGFWIHAG